MFSILCSPNSMLLNTSAVIVQTIPPTDSLLIYLKFLQSDISSNTILKNWGSSSNATLSLTTAITCNSGLTSINGTNAISYATYAGNPSSYIMLPSMITSLNSSYTMMLWMKINRPTAKYTDLMLWTYNNSYGGALILEIDNTGMFCISGPANKIITDTSQNFRTYNTWVHVCAVYTFNATTTPTSFYLNGIFKKSIIQGAGAETTLARSGYIGCATWGVVGTDIAEIYGSVRGVRVYNRALTATEINACYKND